MIKKQLLYLLCAMWVAIAGVACSDDETTQIDTRARYPLSAFAVGVYSEASGNTTYYHGRIDQNAHRVVVGGIENLSSISVVDYTLEEGATIAPDPSTFIGNWLDSQTVTVTTADGERVTYTIVMSNYEAPDPAMKDVIFFDDFDTDGNPDATKWKLCERQTSDWNDEMSESYDQAYVENGVLVLRGEKINGEYQAGGIETQGLFDFTFGKVEVSARITSYPNGAFPAIWMMPSKSIYQDWPACGEIDIMEHVHQDVGIYSSIHNHYYDALKYDDPSHTSGMVAVNDITQFHTYAVEWTADELVFSIDGEEIFTYPNLHLANEAEMMQWPFTADSKFYLILNMGLGGDREGSWPGPIDDDNLPAIMEVDWVKVTQTKEHTQKAVIGYLPLNDHEWDTQYPLIEWDYLTHINACFGRVNADGTLTTDELSPRISSVVQTAHANDVKVLYSIAANSAGEFSQAISTESGRQTLVDAVVAYARDNDLDGIDIDYEEHDNTSADAAASQNLLAFVQALYEAKDDDMLLSCAVYGNWLYYGPEWANYFDFINVMSYDGNNVFSSETPVQHASYADFTAHLTNWSENLGAPKSKIIGGLPAYGYSWDPDLSEVVDDTRGIRYHAILSHYGTGAADTDEQGDATTLYNGRPTIQQKCQYVRDNGYGGVMIWQLLQDGTAGQEDLRLLKTIGETMTAQ